MHFPHPVSGPTLTHVSPEFQNKAQIELRLGSANPLFDRKLLEELHEEGVGKSIYDGGSPKCIKSPT